MEILKKGRRIDWTRLKVLEVHHELVFRHVDFPFFEFSTIVFLLTKYLIIFFYRVDYYFNILLIKFDDVK